MFVSGGLYTVIAWQGFRKLSGEFELDETMFGGHRLGKRGLGVEGKHIVLDGEHILHRRIRRIHWISGQRKAHTRKEGKGQTHNRSPHKTAWRASGATPKNRLYHYRGVL